MDRRNVREIRCSTKYTVLGTQYSAAVRKDCSVHEGIEARRASEGVAVHASMMHIPRLRVGLLCGFAVKTFPDSLSAVGTRCSLLRTGYSVLRTRYSIAVVCGTLILALTGCGGPSHPATVSVRGRVTLDGGEWPAAGRLYFNTLEPAAGFPRRPGRAEFAANGRFTAWTWDPGDGLMPGRYKVGVECWKVPPTMGGPKEVSYVADSHVAAARSPIEFTVEAGKPLADLEWNIPGNPKVR